MVVGFPEIYILTSDNSRLGHADTAAKYFLTKSTSFEFPLPGDPANSPNLQTPEWGT